MQQFPDGTQQRNKRTGEVRVMQGGQWVPMGGAAPAQQPGVQTFGTPNPVKQQQQQIDLTKGQIDVQQGQNELAMDPAQARKAEADARKAELELQALEKKAADPTGALGVEQSRATGFLSRATKANDAYEALGVGSPTLGNTVARAITPDSLEGYVVAPDRQQADANIRAFIASILRYESGAAIPPEEFDSAFKTYFPQPGQDEGTVAAKARLRREAIEALKLGSGPGAAQVEQAEPVVHQGGGGTLAPVQTEQVVDDPALTGLKGEYLRRLGSGQSAQEIVSWAKQAGVPIDAGFVQSIGKQVRFRRENPNAPLNTYDISQFDDRVVPVSGLQQTMNDAAQSAPGAYAIRAGNALSLNTLDNLASNPEQARIAIQDAGRQHPVASTIGDISGGVMAALAGEAGLARMGMAPGFGRSLAADTAYGAGTGAGAADDGSRLAGAAKGALIGGAASAGGQAVIRGGANALSPSGGKLGKLYESGVRPTPGQRFVESGFGGRVVNAAEEGLSSVPVVGAAIRGARQDARDQFQIGAFNEALQDIGVRLPKGMKPGTAPHNFAQRQFDKAYDKARSGLKVRGDTEMGEQVAALGEQVETLADNSARRFYSILENQVMRRISKDGAELSGDAYKKVQSELGRVIRGIRKSKSGDDELADALEDLQHILDGAARRHSPAKAVKALDDADRGYAKFVRIMDAAKGSDAGTFTPNQFTRSVRNNARGKRSEEYLRGEALMQDYAEQGMSLVDRIPNSGTPERQMTALATAGGAQYLEPSTATLLALLGGVYAPGVRKVTTGAMKPRPQNKALADELRKRARIAGAGGAAALAASPDQ